MRTTTATRASDEERCGACDRTYHPSDGWQGLCPACATLVDEHDAGRHDRRWGGATAGACLACLAAGDGYGRDDRRIA